MTRVTSQKNTRQNGGSGHNRGSHTAKQHHRTNKKQKLVLESNSQDKSKPRNVLSFHTDPPPGYTFIPAGNPQLTAALKEFAQRGNHKIYSVSTTPHASRHELSREVHRVGFHFPTFVVAQVCNHYGIRLTRTGRVIDEKQNDNLFMKVYQKGELVLDEELHDQVTINTEAKETIRDLFPNIPDNDLFQIIKTAFQLGDGKVGTADEIPLARRATLSVVAHIRHVYTKYDKLLRRMPYNNARHEVEAETLKKLVEWRGDGTADSGAMNDILDDVIVISDEENSVADSEDVPRFHQDEVRVEELDGNAYWPASARPVSPLRIDDPPQGFRYAPQTAYYHQPTEAEIAARERNRAARWEQARQDYRSTLTQAGSSYQRILVREPSPLRHLVPFDPPQGGVIERQYLGSRRPNEVEVGLHSTMPALVSGAYHLFTQTPEDTNTAQVISRPTSPGHARPIPVRYERIDDGYRPKQVVYPPYSRPLTPLTSKNRRRSASPEGNVAILPSIEGPNGAYSPTIARSNEEARSHNRQISAGPYRDRDDRPFVRNGPIEIPNHAQRNPFGRSQMHRMAIQDRSPHRQATPPELLAMRREDPELYTASRRVLIPEHAPNYDRAQDAVRTHDNPFQERYLEPSRRIDPLPMQSYGHLREYHTATPPRRILEPIADDPYSDSGPQRYREYLPATAPYHASAPATTQYLTEKRVVYAKPPERYVTTTRYEPLPGR